MNLLLFLGVIALFGGVAGVAWYFSEGQRVQRALRAARVTKVAEVVEGEIVRVTGRVRLLGVPLVAPLSGRACAEYHVRVTQQNGKTTHILVDEQRAIDFLIEDDSGLARVSMHEATVDVAMDARYSSGTFHEATPELESFLVARGRTSHNWLFNKDLTYVEGVLEVRERVTVLGRARWEPNTEVGSVSRGAAYRESPKRLVLEAPPGAKLLVSDDPSTVVAGSADLTVGGGDESKG